MPATATGLYKWLLVLGVSTAISALLNVVDFLASLFFVQRIADVATLVSFICWWCVVAIVCCKASQQDWLRPIKTSAIAVTSIVVVVQLILLSGSLITLVSTDPWAGDERLNKQLRYLRFLRLLPLLELVGVCVLFCKVRTAARLSLKTGPPAQC